MRSGLTWDVLVTKRESLTRDAPFLPEGLGWVTNTSTLISGERDAVLVDTFVTREQNAELVEWVKSKNVNLTTIYVTHGHGDHFFGVADLLDAFPGARAVATPGSVEKAREHASRPVLESFWNVRFPGAIRQDQVVPEALDGDTIDLEGHALQILDADFTDTAATTVLWVPDAALLVAGDVVYNDTHIFLAETDAGTRASWRATLGRLAELGAVTAVAGHKHPDSADDASHIRATLTYLDDFEALAAEAADAEGLYRAIVERNPHRANPGSAWAASKRVFGLD
jgi:glyoxylase-like metal-dependent hydrolase (beta-lactamase superfamily II)